MQKFARLILLCGAFSGFVCIALGAFGAHALKGVLSEYSLSIWDTAVNYQMFHTVLLLILGAYTEKFESPSYFKYICSAFVIGLILFCGSLYALALLKMKWLGIITPLGGVILLCAWLALFLTFFKLKSKD